MAHEITDSNFEELIVKSGKVALLDFWAEWCGPCRMLTPIVNELHTEFEGRAVIGKVNVDENNAITLQHGIRNIPTILFFEDGVVVNKVVGTTSKSKLAEILNQLL
jgi:thioredoxin 1